MLKINKNVDATSQAVLLVSRDEVYRKAVDLEDALRKRKENFLIAHMKQSLRLVTSSKMLKRFGSNTTRESHCLQIRISLQIR